MLLLKNEYDIIYSGGDKMECINTVLATNILKFRQIQGMTQKELAEKLGVSNQSISKWETAKSTPDIALLPILADVFHCYIDQLFSRQVVVEPHFDLCTEFPWPDDTIMREVLCNGRKIIKINPIG